MVLALLLIFTRGGQVEWGKTIAVDGGILLAVAAIRYLVVLSQRKPGPTPAAASAKPKAKPGAGPALRSTARATTPPPEPATRVLEVWSVTGSADPPRPLVESSDESSSGPVPPGPDPVGGSTPVPPRSHPDGGATPPPRPSPTGADTPGGPPGLRIHMGKRPRPDGSGSGPG